MSGVAETIGTLARAALVCEARLSPKPGLVDAEHNGAHEDMNLDLLVLSAETLEPFFALFAEVGIAKAGYAPDGMLASIREDGKAAERTMLFATNGVNTHKGALFLLGALCYAAGYCAQNSAPMTPETVCSIAGRACAGVTRELGAGAGRAFARYGAAGARGEAEAGYPNVLAALTAYQSARKSGAGEEDAWLIALLSSVALIADANVLSRCGEETAQQLKTRAKALVQGFPSGGERFLRELRALDRDCIASRASPGGSADLLACAMFLQALCSVRL